MFFRLFGKECIQTGKSLIYWIYSLCVLLFFFTQMGSPSFDNIKEPVKGQEESYGMVYSKEEDLIMESILGELAEDYSRDHWITYPIGFSKHITLSEEERKQINEILEKTTGLSEEEREEKISDFYQESQTEQGVYILQSGSFFLKPVKDLTYREFQKEMEKICEILGPGSGYEEELYESGVAVPATYEDAKKEYDNYIKKDKIAGGYARLFSDYIGIILGLMPVFVAVTRCLRDRRSQMKELIYVRAASSFSIVFSRYAAMVLMMLLPVLLASCYTWMQCAAYAAGVDVTVNGFAFLPYVFGWLLPEIMVVSAVGMCLTELTDTAIAILVQGIWWFGDIFGSSGNLSKGQYGFHLVMRHNSAGKYQIFQEHFHQLVTNRIFYTVLALVLMMICVWIYGNKRKGRLERYGAVRSNGKRKSKA